MFRNNRSQNRNNRRPYLAVRVPTRAQSHPHNATHPNQEYQPSLREKRRINHITSPPSSTKAEIRYSVITINDLEEFHKNNLEVKQLVLISCAILVPNGYTLPTNIQPSHNLKSLILDRDSEIWDKDCISMDYINIKYPNLARLEFLIRIASDSYKNYANLLIRTFPDTRPTYSHGYNIQSYDSRKEALNYFKDFYKEGGNRFLSNLPKTLQILKINTSIFKRPIQSLKESGINPRELVFYAFSNDSAVGAAIDIFDDIMCSTQAVQYFQELPCLESLSCSLGFATDVFNGKFISSSIKHLNIGTGFFGSRNTIDLNKVFIAFPSLEELLISDAVCFVTASPITDNQVIYPNFRLLQISSSYDTATVKFMRASLPNIRVLERMFMADIHEYHTHPEDLHPIMSGCVDMQWQSQLDESSIKRYTIDLTGLNLDIFHLRTNFSYIRGDFEAKLYLKIKSGTTIKAYSLIIIPGGFKDVKPASKTVGTYDIDVPNRITINCDHIGIFKFNDYVVFDQNIRKTILSPKAFWPS